MHSTNAGSAAKPVDYAREVRAFDEVTANIIKHSYSCGFFQKKAELKWRLHNPREEASSVVDPEGPGIAEGHGDLHYVYELKDDTTTASLTTSANEWLGKDFKLVLEWWLEDTVLKRWSAKLFITLPGPERRHSTDPFSIPQYYPRKIHSAIIRIGDQEVEITDIPLESDSPESESLATQTLVFQRDDLTLFRGIAANTPRGAFQLDVPALISCTLTAKCRPSDLLERPIHRVCSALQPRAEGLSHINQLNTLFSDPLTGNYSVKTGAHVFYVDKSALNRTSPVFRALFSHGTEMEKAEDKPYEFLNIAPEAVRTFLVFSYLRATPELEKCAADVAILADMLQVPELVGKAEFYLIRNALQLRTPNDIMQLAELAVALNLKKLLLILHFVSHERLGTWSRYDINTWTEFLVKEPRFSLGYAKGVKVGYRLRRTYYGRMSQKNPREKDSAYSQFSVRDWWKVPVQNFSLFGPVEGEKQAYACTVEFLQTHLQDQTYLERTVLGAKKVCRTARNVICSIPIPWYAAKASASRYPVTTSMQF